MKIAFFSETGNNRKYPRDFPNARTEVAWCLALDAPMCSLGVLPNEQFDLGIVIVPKERPRVDLDFIRKCCDKVAIMQEGPHWYFQDYTIEEQFHYYNTLMSADWVYCHNISDIQYYKGLGCKDVRVMRSLMITDDLIPRNEWGNATMVGGNMVSWYGGFDSYMVASVFQPECEIYAPSMGRKQKMEDQIEDINYLHYQLWKEWVTNLSQFEVGIHLMRTHAAGTFAMNCAWHGIPCIGYKGLDTQEICHPNLTVDLGDLHKARELAVRLKEEPGFYDECSKIARDRWEEEYSEEHYLSRWNKFWSKQ